MSDKKPEPEKAHQPGEGIRSMRSTTLFRAVNFELYAKPVSISIQNICKLGSQIKNSMKCFDLIVSEYCDHGRWKCSISQCSRLYNIYAIKV